MNDQDQIDNSMWQNFIKTDVTFWSDAMLKQAISDLRDEQNRRPQPEYQSAFLDELGKVGQELVDKCGEPF